MGQKKLYSVTVLPNQSPHKIVTDSSIAKPIARVVMVVTEGDNLVSVVTRQVLCEIYSHHHHPTLPSNFAKKMFFLTQILVNTLH